MNKEEKNMLKFLQNQLLAVNKKVRKQAREIEKYRIALSKIEEVIHEI